MSAPIELKSGLNELKANGARGPRAISEAQNRYKYTHKDTNIQ